MFFVLFCFFGFVFVLLLQDKVFLACFHIKHCYYCRLLLNKVQKLCVFLLLENMLAMRLMIH